MKNGIISLPKPDYDGKMPLEAAIKGRRSIRNYSRASISLKDFSQILWAANGISNSFYRTVPSAGATYPLEVYAAVGNVATLQRGVYQYIVKTHDVKRVVPYDLRDALSRAALHQTFIAQAPLVIIITAFYRRTTARYRERGIRYVHMEAGHCGQNISLQAVALGLGTVMVGAFHDENLEEILSLHKDENPLYIIPVGRQA